MAYAFKSRSLFKESIRLAQATAGEWWPWVLVFGLFYTLCLIVSYQMQAGTPVGQFMLQHPEMANNPSALIKNKELFNQYQDLAAQSSFSTMGLLVFQLLGMALVSGVASYVQGSIAVRRVYGAASATTSVAGFFYWFRRVARKYVRPILWMFLPVIGWYFAIRLMVRRTIVSPLAIRQTGDELQASWNLTENNFWRIFGNGFLLGLCLALVVLVVGLVIGVISSVITHGEKNAASRDFVFLAQGLCTALNMVFSVSFVTVTCGILEGEKAQNNPADSGQTVL